MTSALAPVTAGRSTPGPWPGGRQVARWLLENRAPLLAGLAAIAIAIGGLLHLAGAGEAGHQVWRAAVAVLAAELAFEVGHTVIVDRHCARSADDHPRAISPTATGGNNP